jgi:hypothetical protein
VVTVFGSLLERSRRCRLITTCGATACAQTMARPMLALAALLCLESSAAAISVPVEHLWGGARAAAAGAVEAAGPALRPGAAAAFAPARPSAADARAFARLVEEGGLYTLRLPADPAAPAAGAVVASLPARCWAAAAGGDAAALVLLLGERGRVVAAELDAPCGLELQRAPPAGGAAPALPAPRVELRAPAAAPAVAAVPAAAAAAAQQLPPPGAKGAGAAKPKDERTWLQRNWLTVAAVAFIIFNRAGGAALPEGGGGAAGGAPAAAGAPRR